MLLLIATYVVAITLLLLSVYMRYWRGKRKFERRNSAGNEQFHSYNDALKSHYSENAVQFLYILFTVIGIMLLLLAIFAGKDIALVTHF